MKVAIMIGNQLVVRRKEAELTGNTFRRIVNESREK